MAGAGFLTASSLSKIAAVAATGHGSSFGVLARVVAMTDRGPANPLSVFVTVSDHGRGHFSPLSAHGMGRAAGEPDVRCGRVW